MPESTDTATITVTLVPAPQRAGFLPRHFGPQLYLKAEGRIYVRTRQWSDDYNGGLWRFYELSNGGFYMAPDYEHLHIQSADNFFDGVLSGDAAGIAATICVLSDLSFHLLHSGDEDGAERIADAYYALRDYAAGHPEAASIFGAID